MKSLQSIVNPIDPMDSYLQMTKAKLSIAFEEHIVTLLEEVGSPTIGPLTNTYVDDILQRMVINGSSPDVIIHGYPDVLQKVQQCILMECSSRWLKLRTTLLNKTPDTWEPHAH